MPLSMVKGTFRLAGTAPGGDTVRFYPDDPDVWSATALKVRANAKGGVQLRLDGVGALETHYNPRFGRQPWRQPAELGEAASAALLEQLGFRTVARADDGTVTGSEPAETSGYILTRFADAQGRVVAFAYRGSRRARADDKVWLDVTALKDSANYQLLAAGLVYPTFYSLLYPELRQAMADVAVAAREDGAGVWADDATLPGFTLRSRQQLRTDLVVLPTLFRRLADYLSMDNTGKVSLKRFTQFLDARGDRLFTVPDGHATGFDTLVETRRQTLRLALPPEQLVFLEK